MPFYVNTVPLILCVHIVFQNCVLILCINTGAVITNSAFLAALLLQPETVRDYLCKFSTYLAK